ncbi:sensor histidine kinase [Parafilimonas terrae]|jgi:signal transduction histidine kinase|uniref:Histidine kinase-, DNA gyrase B-, and HSP90-like ATPase n=1 Tax=Parafilimonas terrae TaxID=1465490 RepID=A0A1I5WBN2_9BACT|nr:ATP-binding protein [Parafilimonas terrae]SFQ16726.1 Histidine kinase-, DNA gyrase B-, and HSP90-like ATPase [Parafilimonas terrae]
MPPQEHPPGLIAAIIVATIVLLLAGIFIFILVAYFNGRKKRYIQEKQLMQLAFNEQLLKAQLETQEHAFNQVSQELHDNIGQLLSSTKMLLSLAGMEIKHVPDTFKTAEESLAHAIQDLRTLSKSLNTEWIQQFDFMENLKWEKDRINAARNISVNIKSDYEQLPVDAEAQVMLFRVVQEAIQNTIKHAHASAIKINIKKEKQHICLSVNDNGTGFSVTSNKHKSLGLRNMEHRVKLLKGTIDWISHKEAGTSVIIQIPDPALQAK